jgi:hypothetical protein
MLAWHFLSPLKDRILGKFQKSFLELPLGSFLTQSHHQKEGQH